MARRQRIGLSQNQRLQLTPGLQASIALLRMDAGGLTRFLEEQAERNPFLKVEAAPLAPAAWLPRWGSAFAAARRDAPETAQPGPSLMAHVLSQIDVLTRSPRERQIALVLAEALEPFGWLGRPLPDLARQAGCAPGDAEAVLMRLQTMEPTGLFARSLSECLRLQAAEAGRLDAAMEVMLDHLDLLAEGKVDRLAALAGTTEAEILARLRLIRSFDPKPGAQFDPGEESAREPDLVVARGPQGWQITLNRSALPALELKRPATAPSDAAERAALAAALSLQRMVERRNATLLAVAREIMARQAAVLEKGLGALVPLTMIEVAEALELHESTVSRVVAGTCVSTPMGTWRLRALFGPRLGDASPAAVRAGIVRLVAAEDPRRPLTDAALTEALAGEGRKVARRTVAKYREMLRIPRAGLRRLQRR
jgi:RNA polymerase sigma-54 factor